MAIVLSPCRSSRPRRCGKGSNLMLLTEGEGVPIAVEVHSASPAEVKLIEPLLKGKVIRRKIRRLLYDRAADSDPLRSRLRKSGTELICPHRSNRTKPPTQDGRPLRRYKRRWKVERTNAWLQHFRRLVVRYERLDKNFEGLAQAACMLITLRKL